MTTRRFFSKMLRKRRQLLPESHQGLNLSEKKRWATKKAAKPSKQ